MYWFILKAIMSAIIGSSFYQWWQGTKMGLWFQKHVDTFMEYLAEKFDIEVAKKDKKFRKKYPLVADRIEALEEIIYCWEPDFDVIGTVSKGQINELKELTKQYSDKLWPSYRDSNDNEDETV